MEASIYPNTPPPQAGVDWNTPLSIRVFKKQSDALLQDLHDLPQPIFSALETTLKGGRTIAYSSALY